MKNVKSATGLHPDDFLAVFKFLNSGPHSENPKIYMKARQRWSLKNIIRM